VESEVAVQFISVDWSHTKGLTTFDGKKTRNETADELIKRIAEGGKESKKRGKSSRKKRLPSLVIEQGCPLLILYKFTKAGFPVSLISDRATEDYRKEHWVEKSDEKDARIIWELANNGAKLQKVAPDDRVLRVHDLYHQYCRYQKARVAMENMKAAHQRAFGGGESTESIDSNAPLQPPPLFSDLSPYNVAIEALKSREKRLLGEIERVAEHPSFLQNHQIKGLGTRIRVGIMVTANPTRFKCLSAYLRYCGLVNPKDLNYRYNRHARMLYRMLADEVVRLGEPRFRPIYDKCKADIAERHPDYTKRHIHNAALNRTATFLAKEIYGIAKKQGILDYCST